MGCSSPESPFKFLQDSSENFSCLTSREWSMAKIKNRTVSVCLFSSAWLKPGIPLASLAESSCVIGSNGRYDVAI